MKESKLLKQVADKQMPDLDKIRENIIASQETQSKAKALRFKPSRLIAVASVAALALAGTIAAVASGGNGFLFFNPKPAVVSTADEAAPETKAPAKKENKNTSKTSKSEKLTKEEKSLKQLNEQGFELDWIETVGNLGSAQLVYGSDNATVDCDCDYIIDGFTFRCKSILSPYGLGLYVINNNRALTLADACSQKLVDMRDVVSLLDSKQSDIDFDFTYSVNGYFEDWLCNRLQRNVSTVVKLGSVDNYEIFYNIRSNNKGNAEEVIGNYTFRTNRPKRDYPLGLYVTNGEKNMTLGEAVESGEISDIKAVISLIESNPKTQNHFTIDSNVIETEAPTESETESVTEVETDTNAQHDEADETNTKNDNQ